MKRDAAKRRLCMRFERGETFCGSTKSHLNQTPTTTTASGGGKPPHKIRNSYNFIRPIVEDKVSAATQRIPGFNVDPSTNDPEDAGAAKLAEKAAIYGYDQWRMRGTAVDAVKTAIAHGGASYTMPYWEPNVGPYVNVDNQWVGQGDVRLTSQRNEVYWRPAPSSKQALVGGRTARSIRNIERTATSAAPSPRTPQRRTRRTGSPPTTWRSSPNCSSGPKYPRQWLTITTAP
jgi:hypothetical protein